MTSSLPAIARVFIDRINAHDVDGLVALMTDVHVFIDAAGASHGPRDAMEVGWREYFSAFPDYLIEIDDVVADGDRVIIAGTASGTHSSTGKSWRISAAWKAVVRDGLVAEWRVWCDVEPMLRSMGIDRYANHGE